MKRQIARPTPAPPPPTDRPDEIEEARERRFLKAMALKEDIGLSDAQRYSLAQMIPGVDKDYGGSWKELNPKQLHDLITMMEGWVFITHMKMMEES